MRNDEYFNDVARIRRLLLDSFDDAELDAFCLDHFPEVYARFSRRMRRDEKITLLLDYCRRSGELYGLQSWVAAQGVHREPSLTAPTLAQRLGQILTDPIKIVAIASIGASIMVFLSFLLGLLGIWPAATLAPTLTPTETRPATHTAVVVVVTPESTPTPTRPAGETVTPIFTPGPTHIPPTRMPTQTPTIVPTLLPTSTPIPLPTAIIEAEWPKKMEVARSDTIRVSLVRTREQTYVPTIEVFGHTVVAATPIPVGTPGPIESAFGPEYEAFAVANLATDEFEIQRVGLEVQSLEQPTITWEWRIKPKNPGPQFVNVSIEATWKPKGGDGTEIRRQIWRARLDISVEKPLIPTDSLGFLTFVSLSLGSGFSGPWVYEQVKKRRGRQEKHLAGIPPVLYSQIREALLACGPFEGDNQLRAVFAHPNLMPWEHSVPEALSPAARVEATIAFLGEKQRSDTGENALALLLRVLSEGIDPGDARHQRLADLAGELEAALGKNTGQTLD